MYNNIYVFCHSRALSGGGESLHQLVDTIRQHGGNAYIFYYDMPNEKVNDKFKKYNISTCEEIEDCKDNLIILSEMDTHLRFEYQYCQIAIWWLSKDFYFKKRPFWGTVTRCLDRPYLFVIFPVIYVLLIITKKTSFCTWTPRDVSEICMHFYNCELVHQYLSKKGVPEEKMHYLCGPLNTAFFENNIKNCKQDIVLYNPKKGMKYTRKVVKKLEQKKIITIPLEDMSREEIISNMKKAKIYIDFGFFPGPERIPREAVMLGCNIITSTNGSAKNDMDVPIPLKYKFKKNRKNINYIVAKVEDMINTYESDYKDFDEYRNKVVLQKRIFVDEICNIFLNNVQGDNEVSKLM